MEEIRPELEVVKQVGVFVAPDDTDPFNYHPFRLEKTISYLRDLEINGAITVGKRDIYTTATYSYGFEAIDRIRDALTDLGVGQGVVKMKAIHRPIVLLPEQERESWRTKSREYYDVPSDWIDISTPEGAQFFEDHLVRMNSKQGLFNETIYEQRRRFSIGASEQIYTIYDSELSAQENFTKTSELLATLDIKQDEALRQALGLETA